MKARKLIVLLLGLLALMSEATACKAAWTVMPIVLSLSSIRSEATATVPPSTPLAWVRATLEPALTRVPSPAAPSTKGTATPPKRAPEPYFPYMTKTVKTYRDPAGRITGRRVGKEIGNRGGPGAVCVTIQWENRRVTDSKVFHMREGEHVMVWASFPGLRLGVGHEQYKWTVRPALPDDASHGEVDVIRSTMEKLAEYPGSAEDIVKVGDLAYTLQEGSLCTLDLSRPLQPSQVGDCTRVGHTHPLSEYRLAVRDGYAYVTIGHRKEAVEENGLHTIHLSSGRRGQYSTGAPYSPVAMVIAGSHAYVATQKQGLTGGHLLVLDIVDPLNPREVARHDVGGVRDLAVQGGYAYLVGYGRLHVVDVRTPNAPVDVVAHRYRGTGSSGAERIVVRENHAYVMDKSSSLIIFDVSTPSAPIIAGQWSPKIGSRMHDMAMSGDHAYLAAGDGLFVIDVGDTSTPTEVGRFVGGRTGGRCVMEDGGYIYLGGRHGIHIFSLQ